MGGRLVVTSNGREGTRVTLTLPAVTDLAGVGVGRSSL
jgi:signal transduction histidine kinase